jgi:hypothetical protein
MMTQDRALKEAENLQLLIKTSDSNHKLGTISALCLHKPRCASGLVTGGKKD